MHEQTKHDQNHQSRWFILHIVVLSLLALLALLRYAPTPPEELDTSPDEFSAGRARATLERLILPGVSHCVGSADHARMRDAVVEEFRALGFEPEIQTTFASNRRYQQDISQVQNIVVRLEGTEGKDAILLVAHYDSVPAGPGAADDGSGVSAILENPWETETVGCLLRWVSSSVLLSKIEV